MPHSLTILGIVTTGFVAPMVSLEDPNSPKVEDVGQHQGVPRANLTDALSAHSGSAH